MIRFYKPKPEDLRFRQTMLADEETMSYNRAWGGTISFPREAWDGWYDRWVANPEGRRFYRYLEDENGSFVGEAAFHIDEERQLCLADVIVYAPFRRRGFGAEALRLLCRAAREAGVAVLYDDIAADNPAVSLFLKQGFTEVYRTDEIIMLKKDLTEA